MNIKLIQVKDFNKNLKELKTQIVHTSTRNSMQQNTGNGITLLLHSDVEKKCDEFYSWIHHGTA